MKNNRNLEGRISKWLTESYTQIGIDLYSELLSIIYILRTMNTTAPPAQQLK